MHKTRIDLSEATRGKVVAILNARLADAVDLHTKCKQAHWNVKGPQFIALHELFDEVYAHVGEHVDTVAERITALAGVAEGTAAVAAKRSTLPAYPLDIFDGRAHLEALAGQLAAFGKSVRQNIDETAELRDADTADLFTEISRSVDKDLWLLEAHLQG